MDTAVATAATSALIPKACRKPGAVAALTNHFRLNPTGGKLTATSSLKADGTADKTDVFAEGWLDDQTGTYRGRPVDVAVGKDGSLFISDDYAGAIYRITYSAP